MDFLRSSNESSNNSRGPTWGCGSSATKFRHPEDFCWHDVSRWHWWRRVTSAGVTAVTLWDEMRNTGRCISSRTGGWLVPTGARKSPRARKYLGNLEFRAPKQYFRKWNFSHGSVAKPPSNYPRRMFCRSQIRLWQYGVEPPKLKIEPMWFRHLLKCDLRGDYWSLLQLSTQLFCLEFCRRTTQSTVQDFKIETLYWFIFLEAEEKWVVTICASTISFISTSYTQEYTARIKKMPETNINNFDNITKKYF